MFLRHRLMRSSDLEDCFACSRDRHLFADSERGDVLRFWNELIQGERCSHSVLEETRPGGALRIVYFCLCVPLQDAFVEDAYAGRQPAGLARELFLAWQRGESPALTVPQIARADAEGGMRVFVMSGFPDGLDPETELMPMLDKVIQWIPRRNSGYRFSEMVIESFADWQVEWSHTAGLSLRIDYAAAGWPVPEGYRDCLFGINAAEAKERVGTPYATNFTYLPPRLFFPERERRLLMHALNDESDMDIADLLCLSPETIKKRWASIFDRVERIAPELLPPVAADDRGRGRGPEKRRRILAYLDHHMAELRPYKAAA